jgi:hypothetical protein
MRKPLIAPLAVALLLLGAVLPLVMPRHCPVNRAACERRGHSLDHVVWR